MAVKLTNWEYISSSSSLCMTPLHILRQKMGLMCWLIILADNNFKQGCIRKRNNSSIKEVMYVKAYMGFIPAENTPE